MRISTRFLTWIAGGAAAATWATFTFAQGERDRVDERITHLHILTDSLRDLSHADDSLDVQLERADSARRARWERSTTITRDSAAAVYTDLYRGSTSDSVSVQQQLQLTDFAPQHDLVIAYCKTLGAEAGYWQSCIKGCREEFRWRLETMVQGQHASKRAYAGRLSRVRQPLAEAIMMRRNQIERNTQVANALSWVAKGFFGVFLLALTGLLIEVVRAGQVVTARGRASAGGGGSWPKIAFLVLRNRTRDFLRATGRVLLKLDHANVLFLLIALIPVYLVLRPSYPVLATWFLILVLHELLAVYRRGGLRITYERDLNGVLASFAGSIDTYTQKVAASPDGRITEEAAKALSIGFLHRIRGFTEVALDLVGQHKFRVTLAVPDSDPGAGSTTHLRVWCYDQTYSDRRWTRLPIDAIGAPQAFRAGTIEIIRDVWAIKDGVSGVPDLRNRHYRSIISIPVCAGGPSGDRLAVVNIDCVEPDFFTQQLFEQRLMSLVMPAVNMIALVLLAIRTGEAYAFEQ